MDQSDLNQNSQKPDSSDSKSNFQSKFENLWAGFKGLGEGAMVIIGCITLVAILGIVLLLTSGSNAKVTSPTTTSVAKQSSTTTSTTLPPTTTVPPPTTTSPPTTTQPKVSDTQAYMNQTQDVSVADLANDPNGYTGEKIHVTGVVESYLYDSGGGDPIGINVSDPNDFTSVVYIDLAGFFDPSQVHKGDQIDIWGKGKGVTRGTNQYGGTISEGSMSGLYISNPSNGYTNY